jgi:hypothetical protein
LILLVLLNESSDTVLLKPHVPLWRTSRGSTGIWGSIQGLIFVWGLLTTWGVVVLFWTGCFVVLCPDSATPPCLVVLVLVGRFMADSSVNRIPAMAVYIRPLLGSFFYGGVSPSKIGLSAPSVERTQLRSTARVFLYT